jgi:hypothetical protein
VATPSVVLLSFGSSRSGGAKKQPWVMAEKAKKQRAEKVEFRILLRCDAGRVPTSVAAHHSVFSAPSCFVDLSGITA